jgi:LacI family transcriptional regulator
VVDVAREAGVSPGTVSRVMHRRPDVAPEICKRVMLASRQLGFMPKVSHRCIAVIAGHVEDCFPTGYVTTMLAMLARQLASRDYSMELISSEDMDLAQQAHVEGVLGLVFDDRIASLREIPNLPILTINRPMSSYGIHTVCTDHHQQGVIATEHLLKRGHRKIAFLEMLPTSWSSKQRLGGYRMALEGKDVEFDPALVHYTSGRPLYDVLARLVRTGATAIVNFSEDSYLEAIHVLTNILGRSIPKDISVVTIEAMPVFQYLTPPHTVVRQPLEQLARVAVEQMFRLCSRKRGEAGDGDIKDITLPCELVERDSVADARAGGT